ncbi:hypothetical protein EVJ58_g50 [Rhodofomes roseus]|uniref:Uncharacterized protein n=1 Tax=Rhodofomes roseus TaxID=34475 RepID=A0A4Y9Z6H2_9APHY|nr:hypothetical protein EVJ58_g50 [Rhodofomes roseus]
MARATRSAGQPDKDKAQDTAPAPRKGGSKKRKRTSNADNGEQPATKQQRTSESQEPPELASEQLDTEPTDALGSGDVPIDSADAENILLVLESIDTQGLLDRVFPLSTESAEPTSGDTTSTPTPSSSTQTYSFRTLLKDSSQYPLRVLRSAVQHLFPISSHPRSRPSEPAAQQLRFCRLALALLDQASFHSVPTPLEAQSIFPTLFQPPSADGEAVEEDKPAPPLTTIASRKRKYALVQHLPTGDWWSSLNSDFTLPSEGKALTDLPTGHAELAAILPSASTSSSARTKTLAEYVRPNTASATLQLPGLRRVSCGKFLDYGPYASFAPTFDQDGTEVGRYALGELIWRQRQEATLKEKARGKRKAIEALRAADADNAIIMGEETARSVRASGQHDEDEDADELDKALESLVSAEEVARIKAALGSLEMEQAVQELLDKNARAMLRLQRLQRLRLGAEGGGSSTVEEGSEEWETAQAILDSLSLLASLRPRSSSDPDSNPPLVPPASVLRTLQRSLPLEGTEGWYGTLPATRATALRDDTTVHIKPGAEATAAPTTTTTVAVPVTPAKPAATPTTPYTPYSYNYQTSQYRGAYQYTPGQGGSYYPNPSGTATSSYYPGSQYADRPGPSASFHLRRGDARTDDAAAWCHTETMATNYASFFASSAQAQAQQPQRAVANTVTGSAAKPYQAGTWTGAQGTSGHIAPLPAHLRSTAAAAGGSQPGTPGSSTPYSYYGNYQPTTPAAR